MKYGASLILVVDAEDGDHALEQLESLAKVTRLIPQIDSVVIGEGPEELSEATSELVEEAEQAGLKGEKSGN